MVFSWWICRDDAVKMEMYAFIDVAYRKLGTTALGMFSQDGGLPMSGSR
jgi:hypothetical protein